MPENLAAENIMDETFDYLEETLSAILQRLRSPNEMNEDEWEWTYVACERSLEVLMEVDNDSLETEIQEKIAFCAEAIRETIELSLVYLDSGCRATPRPPSRPRLHIPENQLVFLLDSVFSRNSIASLFRCSTKTIQRRIAEYGLEDLSSFCSMSDADLDAITSAYVSQFPRVSAKSYNGFLHSQGLKVQRQTIRDTVFSLKFRHHSCKEKFVIFYSNKIGKTTDVRPGENIEFSDKIIEY